MNSNFLHRLPRLLYGGVLIVVILYANNTEGWQGIGLLFLILGAMWVAKLCFPLFFRLDQMSRRKSRDDSDAEDA